MTSGIVLAVIIPIIIILAYAAYKIYRRAYKNTDEHDYNWPEIRESKMWRDSDLPKYEQPITPASDEEFTYRSPTNSMRSSSTSSSSKKRRSYDKSYRTHEPLEGLPEDDFEEKNFDLDTPTPSPTDIQYRNQANDINRISPDLIKTNPYNSSLASIKNRENYLKSPHRSQSSIITDV